MAATQLTVGTVGRNTSLLVSYTTVVAGGDGYYFVNDAQKIFLIVDNTTGLSCDVTIDVPNLVDGNLVTASLVEAVANGETRMIGPFPSSIYDQADPGATNTNSVYVSFSQAVDVMAVKLPSPQSGQ